MTVYGTGFQSLGADELLPLPDLHSGISSTGRGHKCLFGDLPMAAARVVYPIGSVEARGALADQPDVGTDDEPLASAIECVSPPWSNASSYELPIDERDQDRCTADDERELCEIDVPKAVCLRVSLNDDPTQHSGDCIPFTYYDQ